jgi:hypothetical protein
MDNKTVAALSRIESPFETPLDGKAPTRIHFTKMDSKEHRENHKAEFAKVLEFTQNRPFVDAVFSSDRSLLEVWRVRNQEPDSKEHYTVLETHFEIFRVRDGALLVHGMYESFKVAHYANLGHAVLIDGQGFFVQLQNGNRTALICHLPPELTK